MNKATQAFVGTLLAGSMTFAATGVASASTIDYPNKTSHGFELAAASSAEERELAKKLEEGFEILFTTVIEQDDSDVFRVRSSYAGQLEGLSLAKAQAVATAFNKLGSRSESPAGTEIGTAGAKEYGVCVLKGIIPGAGLLSIDWDNVYHMIKQHSWGKLAKYLSKHGAKVGLKDLAKVTPWGLASSVPLAMISCAIWG